MNRFFTLLFAASCLTSVGQVTYPYPYNPDGNNDGYISLNDLLDLLSVYGSEFNAGVLATDSISAVYYTGELDYYDCASSCVALRGNWKMLDKDLVGSYKPLLSNQSESAWLDVRNAPLRYSGSSAYSSYVSTSSWGTTGTQTNYLNGCFCQTRTRADIEDINVCEGLEDECGVCNGDGAIYECGCSDIPEGDCDCEGNQLDAIGVCGGDCLEDVDGDGVCDPVLGPCEGQDYVTYHGYDYEIVETADGRCWFAEDLRTKSFANDGEIIEASLTCNPNCWYSFRGMDGTSVNATAGLIEIFSTNSSYVPLGMESTVLYNFHAVVDEQDLCPVGWHVPSVQEFNALVVGYGGSASAGFSLKAGELDGCSSFTFNSSGLEIDARLYMNQSSQDFDEFTNKSTLWTSDYYNPNGGPFPFYAQYFELQNCGAISDLGFGFEWLNEGRAVRCIKD